MAIEKQMLKWQNYPFLFAFMAWFDIRALSFDVVWDLVLGIWNVSGIIVGATTKVHPAAVPL
ncbi:hypothetical protein ACFLXM_01860 [Chloroflexota bacterium]